MVSRRTSSLPGILIANEAAAERVVHEYFERTSPAVVAQPRIADGRKADLLLDYGDETVVVEIKLVRNADRDLEGWISQAVAQVSEYVRVLGASRGAVVLFFENSADGGVSGCPSDRRRNDFARRDRGRPAEGLIETSRPSGS